MATGIPIHLQDFDIDSGLKEIPSAWAKRQGFVLKRGDTVYIVTTNTAYDMVCSSGPTYERDGSLYIILDARGHRV